MKKININNLLFYVSIFFIISYSYLSNVIFLSGVLKYFRIVYILFITLSIILNKDVFEKKSFFRYICIISISIACLITSTNSSIFIFLLFLLGSRKINFYHFIKVDFLIKLLLLLFVIFLYKLDLTNPYIMLRPNGLIRSSIGFSHPNFFSAVILNLVLDFIYLKFDKNKVLTITLLLLSNYLQYIVTDSRTTTVLLLFLTIILLLKDTTFSNIIYNNKIFKFLIKNSYWILFIISIICVLFYIDNNQLIIEFDKLLSNRIYWGKVFYNKYPINLFGNDITMIGTRLAHLQNINMLQLDMGYLNILYFYGVFGVVFYGLVFSRIIKENYENSIFVIVFIIFMLYGFTEASFFKLVINPFILALGKNKQLKKE